MTYTGQYDLQQEILSKTGMNLVTCGNCGSTIIQRKDQVLLVCPDCGFMSEPCDFPDLNNINESNTSSLYEMVTKRELILEEVFLNNDINETDPVEVYCDSFQVNTDFDDPSLVRDEKELILMYAVSEKTKAVRMWRLTDLQNNIAEQHRFEILKSRLAKVTADDEVSIGDIFMHGGYTKELTYEEWEKLVSKELLII